MNWRQWLVVCTALALGVARGQGKPMYELPPIEYSETPASDRVAKLKAEVEAGTVKIEARSAKEFLRWLLAELEVPEESQVLVFSKTSLQIRLISPQTPRALYFNNDIYVGWVPGGVVEVCAQDPQLGVVFYEIDYRKKDVEKAFRRRTSCVSCHASTRTEGIPGVFVRSVFPDKDGQPLGHLGGFLSNDATPMENRWGGYYLTGRGPGVNHIGNRIYEEDGSPQPKDVWHDTLDGVVDTDRYLQPTSDIMALMMLEHQTRVHNVLVRASMRYRRAVHFAEALGSAPAETGSVQRTLETEVADILKVMLFADEARIGGNGMQSEDAVEEALVQAGPISEEGWSLRDTRLHPRLMRYRLSYMIYSQAFADLPQVIRERVLQELRVGLRAQEREGAFAHMGNKERRRIVAILEQTYPDF